ncbi:MAG: hypothetical protein ACLTZM_08540 [Ruminococcus sp.]
MSRDGLTEKNLRDGSSKNISQKAGELPKIRSPEFALDRPEKEKPVEAETKDSRKKRRYQVTESKVGTSEPPSKGDSFFVKLDKGQGRKGRHQKAEAGQADKAGGGKRKEADREPQKDQLSEGDVRSHLKTSVRMEGVREHSAGSAGAYVLGAAEANHFRKKKMVQSYARKKKRQKRAEP